MELLTVVLLPAAFVYYSAGNRFSNLPAYRIAFVTGVVCGLLLVFLNSLFFRALPWNTASVAVFYITVFVSVILLPFVLGPVVLNLLFVSDTTDRMHRAVPQIFGILTVYLPYIVLSRFSVPDIWILVMFPVVIVSIVFLVDICLKRYGHAIRLGPTFEGIIGALVPVFVTLVIIPLLVSFWAFCLNPLLYWIPSLAVIVFSAGIRVKKYL